MACEFQRMVSKSAIMKNLFLRFLDPRETSVGGNNDNNLSSNEEMNDDKKDADNEEVFDPNEASDSDTDLDNDSGGEGNSSDENS